MNVSFPYGNETVQFDSNGNPPGWYDIMNYQQRAVGQYGYVQIGSWKNGTLDMPDWPAKMVTSVCSEPCQNGQIKVSPSFFFRIFDSLLFSFPLLPYSVGKRRAGPSIIVNQTRWISTGPSILFVVDNNITAGPCFWSSAAVNLAAEFDRLRDWSADDLARAGLV